MTRKPQEAVKKLEFLDKHTFALFAEFLSHTAEAKLAATNIKRTFLVGLFREAAAFCMGIAIAPTLIVW